VSATDTEIKQSVITTEELTAWFHTEAACESSDHDTSAGDEPPAWNCVLKCCAKNLLICDPCKIVTDDFIKTWGPITGVKCRACEHPFPGATALSDMAILNPI
jgi:hypothetical protein